MFVANEVFYNHIKRLHGLADNASVQGQCRLRYD